MFHAYHINYLSFSLFISSPPLPHIFIIIQSSLHKYLNKQYKPQILISLQYLRTQPITYSLVFILHQQIMQDQGQRISISDANSQPDLKQVNQVSKNYHIYGMFFCGTCNNIMTPVKQMGSKLEFRCKSCDKKIVDFSQLRGDQCTFYNKQLKPGSKAGKAFAQLAKDLSLPGVPYKCPDCSHQTAYYTITPDQGEGSILIQLICANARTNKCDKITRVSPKVKLVDFRLQVPPGCVVDEESLVAKKNQQLNQLKQRLEEQLIKSADVPQNQQRLLKVKEQLEKIAKQEKEVVDVNKINWDEQQDD